jgi:hypothetical protein
MLDFLLSTRLDRKPRDEVDKQKPTYSLIPPAPHLQLSDVFEAQFVCKFDSELGVESHPKVNKWQRPCSISTLFQFQRFSHIFQP